MAVSKGDTFINGKVIEEEIAIGAAPGPLPTRGPTSLYASTVGRQIRFVILYDSY